MKSTKPQLRLIDMDIGFFISYELTPQVIITRLFRIIPLKKMPLDRVLDFRVARATDITRLNRINWFGLLRSRRTLSPLYTLQAAENRRRIIMRLDRGSHIDMKNRIKKENP